MGRLIVGIDLGLQGGIVVLDEGGQLAMPPRITPIVEGAVKRFKDKKTGKPKTKKLASDVYDESAMVEIVESVLNRADELGHEILPLYVIEKAQTMPGTMGGPKANFQRGLSFGLWKGLLRGMFQRFEIVSPQSWQKVIFRDMRIDDTKQASALVASRLWPNQDWRKSERSRNAHDGLTDAACIAEYGRRTF